MQIHVDKYKMGLYKSLKIKDPNSRFGTQFHMAPEAPGLVGFMCANAEHGGCLTTDEGVRLHSCEKGDYCSTVRNSPVVWIQPIIAYLPDGHDLAEVGIGGGGEDLEREAEIEFLTGEDLEMLL